MTDSNSTQTKICRICEVSKPLSDFYWRKDSNKHRDNCKKCRKVRLFPEIRNSPFLMLIRRLFGKVEIDPAITYKGQPCWLWTAGLNDGGYAMIEVADKPYRTHRLMYQMFVDGIPTRADQCDHLCRVRRCVNPAHLEIVSQDENKRRGDSPAAVNARKTHCINGHPFTKENTYPTKSGGRVCRACHNRYCNARYHRLRKLHLASSS